MIFRHLLIVITLIAALPFPALFGAEEATVANTVTAGDTHGAEAHGDGHKTKHHGLPKPAPVLFYGIGGDAESGKVGPLAVTNSMVVMLIVAAGIILVVQLATRKAKMIPSGLQNFVEWLVESLYDFFESVLGAHMVKKTFWFFATIFIFILFSNWAGLLPGLGTIGWAEPGHHNEHISNPLLRGVNADLNMTLAMAAIFMVLWLYWCIREIGPGGFVGHIFAVKGHGSGFFGIFLVVVFICVGVIEVVSIGVRPVALTFRLYGNVFAGENMLEAVMMMAGPYFGWLAVLPFYLLEVLVGLVQALVFALLTSVFTALMCEHHGEEHSH
jgi:F-type H+-transporting ATPase subunit a